MPISQILEEGGKFDDAALVLREWCGVSASPEAQREARAAFCELLERSPGVASLEFTLDTKGHWRHDLDRGTFDRIVALAVEDRRRFAVLRINFRGHTLSGARVVARRQRSRRTLSLLFARGRAGSAPVSIGSLENLQFLDLAQCGLRGSSAVRCVEAVQHKKPITRNVPCGAQALSRRRSAT